MAARSYEEGFKMHYRDRLANVSEKTTEGHIQQIYDNWAREFDKDFVHSARAIYHKPLTEFLDEAIKQYFTGKAKDDVKILDVGAGTGLIGVELNKLGYTNIRALDISHEMLNEAKKKNVYKKFTYAPVTDKPIPEIESGELDALICGGSLLVGHIRPTAFEEMIRIVTIGGLVCFNIREGNLPEYQGKMTELESKRLWKIISKITVPFFEREDVPKETFVFLYQVLEFLK